MLESAGILLDKIVRKYADIFVCIVYPLNKTIWYNEIYQLLLSVGVRIGRCSLWSVGNALFLFAYSASAHFFNTHRFTPLLVLPKQKEYFLFLASYFIFVFPFCQ